LGALSACGALSIDMYLPALPVMAEDLDARAALIQLTLTVFVVGLAVGQVVVGPLSDAWGRRRLVLGGLAIYVAGSVACIVAPTVGWLIAGRVLQSLGAAAATVLSRAIVRDLFDGTAATRFFSTLMLVNGVAPVVAPVIGGELLHAASWRVMFLVLALGGAALLLVVGVGLPESLPEERRRGALLWASLRAYVRLCRDVSYLRYVVTAALMFASMFAYISGSSFVLQDIYGLTAQQYSFVFAVNGLGIMLLGGVNGLLVGRVANEHTLLGLSLLVGAIGGCGVLVSTLAGLPLSVLLGCLFAVVSMLGPVLASATSLALADHADASGAASSLQGLLQFLVGGIVASAMGAVGQGSAVAMGGAVCLCATGALAVFASGLRTQPAAAGTPMA
jgi:DHA1 family bicyclomycin/chloramphenicol resistance-like MFS transporter